MKNITKKIIAALLTVVMLLSVAPIASLSGLDLFSTSASAGNYGVFEYVIEEGGATIMSCNTEASGKITIPSTIKGYSVKRISSFAFNECEKITSIIIPDSVEEIYNGAFLHCKRLKNISFPKNMKRIGAYTLLGTAYYDNKQNWKNNALYVGDYLVDFNGNIKGAYTVNEGTKLIADEAFFCLHNLTSVSIPDSVKIIGYAAFKSCEKLKSVKLPKNLKNIDYCLFFECSSLESVTIPKSVTSIGNSAFYFCTSLKSVTIPSKVKTIGDAAFEHCESLKSIKIPASVKTIRDQAFAGCKSLKSVTIPKSVTRIGEEAFGYVCEEENIYLFYKDPSFKINCYKNSAGLKYAKENELDFKVLDASNHTHSYKTKTINATTTVDGCIKSYCTICGATASKGNTVIPKIASIKLSKTSFSYDGKAKKPKVVVTDSKGKKLTLNKDYTVEYDEGRKKVGNYSVVVYFMGDYSGIRHLLFKIVPAKTTGVKVTADKKAAKVSWNKAPGAKSYEVYYSTAKDGKYKKAGTTTKLNLNVNNLKSAKTYYFKVRAFVKESSGLKFNGSFSEVKSVKVK